MSQSRQKKQLSLLDSLGDLTDHELREALKSYDQNPGPITDSTRNIYRKKLASLLEDGNSNSQTVESKQRGLMQPNSAALEAGTFDDDDDTSDEDYNVQDEDTEDDDDTEFEDEDEEEEEIGDGSDDVEPVNQLDEDIKLSSTTNEGDSMTTSVIVGPDATPNRISRNILVLIISFFVAIFSLYLFSTSSNNKLFMSSPPMKTLTKQFLVLLSLSPIGYAIYKGISFYKLRRHEEMQRVYELVNEALELLQSPDNPKGMMPTLHIRDTLLTPAERKTKKMTNLWNKAVKFIEEHESRVKVELVTIDGEDFRSWKWIGSRKV